MKRIAADVACVAGVIALRALGYDFFQTTALLLLAVAAGAVGAVTVYAWRRP